MDDVSLCRQLPEVSGVEVMESIYIEYASIILVIVGFCVSYNIFVTPAKLEKILKERAELCNNSCKDSYTTREEMQIERRSLMADVRRELHYKGRNADRKKRVIA